MIEENEQVADIERLDRHEFNMDVEERQKLVADQGKIIKEVTCLELQLVEKILSALFS